MKTEELLNTITANPSFRDLATHVLLLIFWSSMGKGEVTQTPQPSIDERFFDQASWKVHERSADLAEAFRKRLEIYKIEFGSISQQRDYLNSIVQTLSETPVKSLKSYADLIDTLLLHLEDHSISDGYRSCPNGVVRLLTSLARMHNFESVYDPNCSTGRLLSNLVMEIVSPERSGCIKGLGQSISETAVFHSMLRAFFYDHGLMLEKSDALKSPPLDYGHIRKFDLVISDLSNGFDSWNQDHDEPDRFDRFRFGIPPRGKGDWALIQHMLATMDAYRGVTIVIVDQAVLSRSGKDFEIRRAIIDSNLLDCIIYLPPKLYKSDPRSFAILIFKASRNDSSVLLVDGSKLYTPGKSLHALTDSGIEKISHIYSLRLPLEDEAIVLHAKDLHLNGYAINPGRYFSTKPRDSIQERDLDSLCNERKEIKIELCEVAIEIDRIMGILSKI